MLIDATQIATNHYAPDAFQAINMYSTRGVDSLTLGQVIISVCLGAAAAYEGQSVLKMNRMTSGSTTLQEASSWLEQVANGTANWSAAKTFAVEKLGVESSALPDAIDTYDKRMKAAGAFKAKMDTLALRQQEDMIDLQTLVNRRDVAFSTSSNVIRALGNSSSANATNF